MVEDARSNAGASDVPMTRNLGPGAGLFVASALLFLTGGVITIQADPPPSTAPVLGMVSHALFFLGIAFLALGMATLLRRVDSLRAGLAGYLATGIVGLGVLHGLQWVTWAYVDVRASQQAEYDVLVDAVFSPFGAGHLLMYGVLLGSGIAFFGWALVRTRFSHKAFGWTAIVVGGATALTSALSLLLVLEGGGDGHVLFNVSTLLLPVLYLWAAAFGLDVYRRG